MDIKEKQELIKFVSKSGVSEVELESKGFKLIIKTGNQIHAHAPAIIHAAPPATAPAASPQTTAAPVVEKKAEAPAPKSNLITIKSPMIGTFYRSAGPD